MDSVIEFGRNRSSEIGFQSSSMGTKNVLCLIIHSLFVLSEKPRLDLNFQNLKFSINFSRILLKNIILICDVWVTMASSFVCIYINNSGFQFLHYSSFFWRAYCDCCNFFENTRQCSKLIRKCKATTKLTSSCCSVRMKHSFPQIVTKI